jgi:uncharacterized protein
MINHPLFWIYLFFQFQIFIYMTNRISFHPRKWFFSDYLWTPFCTIVILLPQVIPTRFLLKYWDFTLHGWGALTPLLKGYTAVAALWVLALWVDFFYWKVFRKKPEIHRLIRRRKMTVPATLRAPLSFLKYFWFENQIYQPEVVEYEVELPGWPKEFSGLSLVQVTDIHIGKYIRPDFIEAVVKEAKKLKPDLFAFTGDFIVFKKDIPRITGLFRGFKAPLGVYAVLGNHDHWSEGGSALKQGLEKDGIRVLVNERVYHKRKGKTLAVMGVDDLWFGQKNEKPIQETKADAKILLAHHPDHFFLGKKAKVNLQISGHCHGGQICFPILGPLIIPSAKGRKYASGFVREKESTLFINNGIGCFPPLRTHCPPEIVKLILKSKA